MTVEPWCERDHLIAVDFDASIAAVSVQPFGVRFVTAAGKERQHVLDLFLRTVALSWSTSAPMRDVAQVPPREGLPAPKSVELTGPAKSMALGPSAPIPAGAWSPSAAVCVPTCLVRSDGLADRVLHQRSRGSAHDRDAATLDDELQGTKHAALRHHDDLADCTDKVIDDDEFKAAKLAAIKHHS